MTMSVIFKLPLQIRIETNTNPMDTSYEIICAVDLKDPRKAYLELEDQPARIIPYTPKELTARIYNRPIGTSAKTIPYEIGITDHPIKETTNVRIGASINKNLLALLGMIVSFSKSFNPSLNGLSKP